MYKFKTGVYIYMLEFFKHTVHGNHMQCEKVESWIAQHTDANV